MGLNPGGTGAMSPDLNDNPFAGTTRFHGKKLHMAVTGSISCYKSVDLLRAFSKTGISTSVTVSRGARKFVTPLLFASLGAARIYDDMFADQADPFAHLEPGRICDSMVVAPASANAVANLAHGNAEAMYAAQALAFSGTLVIAPAMNPRMWSNPATQANIQTLRDRKYQLVMPENGVTACGEEGQGRLAKLPEIFLATLKSLAPQDLQGLKVMVTLGPTREAWDGVRFITNPSSGRMGVALATAAWLRGAEVTAICGPIESIFISEGINKIDVTSAREMYLAAERIWPEMDWGLFCAAVGDFSPIRPEGGDTIKIHKNENIEEIRLERNPDILQTLSIKRGPKQKTLGFAAEITDNVESLLPLARNKLLAKNVDIVAANRVNRKDGAFGADDNQMAIVDKNGQEQIWEPQSKADIAWELCTWLSRI